MARGKGVSSKTHTKRQLDDYANQNNPNNKAYRANRANQKAMHKQSDSHFYQGEYEPLDWMCYSNPYDFE